MPWCPKCKQEYRAGFKRCSDCGLELVEELEKPEDLPAEFDAEVFLTTTADGMEADVIEAKLADGGIPVLRKYREAGGYLNIYMGTTPFGVDLYVPSKLLEEAKAIISDREEIAAEEETTVEENALKDMEQSYRKKRQIRAWIVLLVFIPGLIFVIYELIMVLAGMFAAK